MIQSLETDVLFLSTFLSKGRERERERGKWIDTKSILLYRA